MGDQGDQGQEAAADLRDNRVIRATYLSMLMDWDGNDLKDVYEPLSQQVGYIFCFLLIVVVCYAGWKKLQKWRMEAKQRFVAYRVVKPPSTVISDTSTQDGEKRKRVVAVVGGTGFVGSHVVNELVKLKDCYVYVLGRTFRPERTNPDADCLIQIDLQDYDGLVRAFEGVDSVINTSAVLPNAFLSADDVWHLNKVGFDNLLRAAQETSVKSFVHISGMHVDGKPKSLVMKSFFHAFFSAEEAIRKANGEGGLRTCVIGPGNMIGPNNSLTDHFISGKVTSSPMVDLLPCSFMPVEYAAKAIANAEKKLTSGDDEGVAGKFLPLVGEEMSWKTFLTLPTWPQRIKDLPLWQLKLVAKINLFFAKTCGWAPFGSDVIPEMVEFLEYRYEAIDEDCAAEFHEALGVGPPSPTMEEYVKKLVEQYKAQKETQKDK